MSPLMWPWSPLNVALRKESVDRNNFSRLHYNVCFMVALRKESVDRNAGGFPTIKAMRVALRKESVDRNLPVLVLPLVPWCRSPQGERG